MMKSRIALLLIFFVFCKIAAKAQTVKANFEDTAYYNIDWKKSGERYASYYRIPVVKDGDKYKVEYHRINDTLLYKGTIRAVKIEDYYSIEPAIAIRDGYFNYYWPNGNKKREGIFVNDEKAGEWKYYYDSGNIETIEYYYENQPSAYVTNYFRNGDKLNEGLKVRVAYDGDTSFKNHGQWICYYYGKNRISMIPNFSFGILDGPVIYYDSIGNKKTEGSYKFKIVTTTDQKQIRGSYTYGIARINRSEKILKDGKWIYYDVLNNKIQSIQYYKDGMLDSQFVVYHTPTGKIKANGWYENGIRTGEWKIYYNGSDKILSEISYKNSKGRAVFFDSVDNEKIILEGLMERDNRIGKWVRYYPRNGKVLSEENYDNNLLDGTIINYDSSGNIVSELSYKNGIADGKFTYYHVGTKDKWVVMLMANDSFTGYVNTYYPSGEAKRKTKASAKGELAQICYDKTGTIINCDPIHTAATFDGDIMTYIGDNLVYPVEAKENRMEGKVKIGFVIDEYGKIRDPFIVEGFDSRCDEEALRLVSQMPLWIPEKIEGIPVRSYKTLPVVFWLQPEAEEKGNVSAE